MTSEHLQHLTVPDFLQYKAQGRRISLVTCYDYTFARLLARTSIDSVLVGDSAAMVMHGHRSTLNASVDVMRIHTEAVVRGVPEKFVIADMPFLSFRKGVPAAIDAAGILMSAGAQAVKVEGVHGHEDVIERLVGSGVPVMGHLGLQPQSVHRYGGYRVQGRRDDRAEEILREAELLEALGVFAIVLECIPSTVATKVTAALKIPTIGIGAGPGCDGQVLVLQDLLGMNDDFHPKFVRRFSEIGDAVVSALDDYDRAVKDSTFPSCKESFQ